ncbi:HAD family hydrolase [Lachnospiraceae bacterium ZAX-1]
MKKGILFDLDGTLWDCSAQAVLSWRESAKKYEDSIKDISVEEIQSVMGKTMEEIADILFRAIPSKERRMEIMNDCCEEENKYLRKHGGTLFSDVVDTISELRKEYHISIVSNCQSGYIESFMAYYKLEQYIDDFESFGDTRNTKGENIKLVVARNSLDKAIYIGDTQGDYEASAYAGIPFIHARMGYGTVNVKVPYVTTIKEIPEVVKHNI